MRLERPKIRDAGRLGCESRILGKGVARTHALESLVVSGFLRGLSTRDVGEHLPRGTSDLDLSLNREPDHRVCRIIRGSRSLWRLLSAGRAFLLRFSLPFLNQTAASRWRVGLQSQWVQKSTPRDVPSGIQQLGLDVAGAHIPQSHRAGVPLGHKQGKNLELIGRQPDLWPWGRVLWVGRPFGHECMLGFAGREPLSDCLLYESAGGGTRTPDTRIMIRLPRPRFGVSYFPRIND
jgi:hypothetical protein